MNIRKIICVLLILFSTTVAMGCIGQSSSWSDGAAHASDPVQVQELLDSGVDVNTKYRNGETMLHAAAVGNYDVAWLLIENNADVNAKDAVGRIPLHEAAMWGDKDVTLLLLKNGANVNALDNSGKTPIIIAAARNNIEVVKVLLDYNADINIADNLDATPLHYSSHLGNLEITRLLLNNGADINASGEVGTPLLVAASCLYDLYYTPNWDEIESQKIAILKILLEKGANINVRNSEGATPLHQAAGGGSANIVKWLIENGAEVNALDNKLQTPLHCTATYAGYKGEEVVKILLGNGADPSIKNIDGKTARFLAVSNGFSTVSEALREYEDGRKSYSDYAANTVTP
jgi:ankyrin